MLAGQKVWGVLYRHKYGADIDLYHAREAAEKGATNIMLEYLDYELDHDETKADVRKLIEDNDIEEAISIYNEGTEYREELSIFDSVIK